MNQKIKKILRFSLPLILAVAFLAVSFKGVHWHDFAQALSQCRWGYVAASMLIGALAPFIRGQRWRHTLLPFDPSATRLTAYNAINLANASSMAVPYSGEIVRCAVVRRNSKDAAPSYDKLIGTAALERVLDFMCIILLFVVLLSVQWAEFGAYFTEHIAVPAKERLGMGSGLVIAVIIAVCALGCYLVYLGRKRFAFCARLIDILKGLWAGFISFVHMPGKWFFGLETVAIWAIYWLQIVLMSYALPDLVNLTVADCLFLSLAGTIASFLPVPGGFGAYHFVIASALLGLYGIAWEQGIVFATVVHESQAIVFLTLGLVSAIIEALRRQRA